MLDELEDVKLAVRASGSGENLDDRDDVREARVDDGGESRSGRRVAVVVVWPVVLCGVRPPVLLTVELGFRGWPSASAGPTVMSGASGDGGLVRGRPPPLEPQVSGENIAAGLFWSRNQWGFYQLQLTNKTTKAKPRHARVTVPRA